MRKLTLCCSSALALLALTVSVQALPGGEQAAVTSSKSIVMAQAQGGAAPVAGAPTGDDIKKMKKRAATKKRPSKQEMEKIKQHVPPEYHQYLNFR